MSTLTMITTDDEIGEVSRHWLRARAERKAAALNARREVLSAEYRVVERDGRYLVLAFRLAVLS